jgi:peptidoglycan/xylan/chitin deacetylase (PgdA/CDA1 family)
MTGPKRVFLMYHELEIPGRALCQSEPGYLRYVVTRDNFRNQINLIKADGWCAVNVSDSFSQPESPAVVITFDDGCETDLLCAAPMLKEANFGATFYITVGFLGKAGYLSLNQLRQLSDQGFEIGCHSWTHPYLTDLNIQELRKEIGDAKSRLEEITGRKVNHFSCPGGRWDDRAAKVAQESGYLTFATSRTHANTSTTDPFALGRVPVMRGTELKTFAAICRGQGLRQMRLANSARETARNLLGNSTYDRIRGALLNRTGGQS